MAIVRGTREGSPQRVDAPDAIAAALVANGSAEYVTDDKPAEEVKTSAASKRRTAGSTPRGTGRKPRGGGPSESDGGS